MLMLPQLFVNKVAQPDAVVFDGLNDYLTRGADLTGNADTSGGLISVWIKRNAQGTNQRILWVGGTKFFVTFTTDNRVRIDCYNSTAASLFSFQTASSAVTTASDWTHILASWNTNAAAGAKTGLIYIDDVNNSSIGTDPAAAFNINYTDTAWAVGAQDNAAAKLSADVYQLYFQNSFSDITIEATRRKYISADGGVVNMGSDGAIPTGSSPIIFLNGKVDNWHINKGTGGGMTENGALTTAATSPSDL